MSDHGEFFWICWLELKSLPGGLHYYSQTVEREACDHQSRMAPEDFAVFRERRAALRDWDNRQLDRASGVN